MIKVTKRTISKIKIVEYTFDFDSPITVKAEILDGKIKCLIRSGNNQEAISAKDWGIIRKYIETDKK
jgi:hypothetical protein